MEYRYHVKAPEALCFPGLSGFRLAAVYPEELPAADPAGLLTPAVPVCWDSAQQTLFEGLDFCDIAAGI